MHETMKNKKVAILVTDGFEQVELTRPRKALEDAGAVTKLLAPKGAEVQGFNHAEKGDKFKVDQTLDQANPNEFDAVLLPGGVFNADNLRVSKEAQEFVRSIDRSGKPIAVICHGPWLLVSAGLVKGRKMTSYHTLQDDIRNAGAEWVDGESIRDRNWVSSRKPDDIPAFNREMIKLIEEPRPREEARNEQRTEARQ